MTDEQVIAELEAVANGSRDAMKKAEFTIANEIAVTAIQLAPEDTAQLQGSIGVVQSETTSIEVTAPYAAYLEFGSGNYAKEYVATLPKEWQDEAIRFFINGEGRTMAHPFLYPSVQQHIGELPIEVNKELQKLTQ